MGDTPASHLKCPYCTAYAVGRLFLGSVGLDSCECDACGARWDEDHLTGAFRGRASLASVVVPRASPS